MTVIFLNVGFLHFVIRVNLKLFTSAESDSFLHGSSYGFVFVGQRNTESNPTS